MASIPDNDVLKLYAQVEEVRKIVQEQSKVEKELRQLNKEFAQYKKEFVKANNEVKAFQRRAKPAIDFIEKNKQQIKPAVDFVQKNKDRLKKVGDFFAKQGKNVEDLVKKFPAIDKFFGQLTKALGSNAAGKIVSGASLGLGIAGVGLAGLNFKLTAEASESASRQFDLYGRELGRNLAKQIQQEIRLKRVERLEQANSAAVDTLAGAVGEIRLYVNRELNNLLTKFQAQNFSIPALQAQINAISQSYQAADNVIFAEISNIKSRLKVLPSSQNPQPQSNNAEINQLKTRVTKVENKIKGVDFTGLTNKVNQVFAGTASAINRLNQLQRELPGIIQRESTKLVNQEISKIRVSIDKKLDKDKFTDELTKQGNTVIGIVRPVIDSAIKPYELAFPVIQNTLGTTIQRVNTQDLDIKDLQRKDKERSILDAQSNRKLDDLKVLLYALPLTITKAAENTTTNTINRLKPEIPPLAAQGFCRTLQPGGCSRKAFDDLGNSVNANTNNKFNNLLNAFNGGANAAQLTILNRIDGKLGAQINGGLSGGIKRLFDNAIVDRAINTYALILTFHNAAMLSNSLFESILGAGDLILQALGYKVKDSEGNQIDLSQAVRSLWQGFLSSIFGAETVRQINENWARWNRIYQSAANLLSLTQSMFDSLRSVLEVSAQYTGKIGNALKSAGVVFDDAYDWMSERVSSARGRLAAFQRFADGLESAENVTSNVASVAGSVVSVQSELNEFKQEQTNFTNAINNQKTEKEQAEANSTQVSKSPAISIVQERSAAQVVN